MKSFRPFLIFLCASLFPNLVFGQFGNEWIDFSKTYYKFKVAEDGIYRIQISDLKASGMPTDNISGVEYRMFGLGKEVRLHVTGQYIEFYGHKNDGKTDQVLYENPSDIAHTEYSMYSDTAIYYLTYTPGSNGLRYIPLNDGSISGKSEIKYHDRDDVVVYPERFYFGARTNPNVIHPKMNDGEGLLSAEVTRAGNSYRQADFNVTDFYEASGKQPTIETLVFGARHRSLFYQLPDGTIYDTRPKLSYKQGNSWVEFLDDHLRGFETRRYDMEIPTSVLKNTTASFQINVDGSSYDGDRLTGQICVSHFRLRYTARFDLKNALFGHFKFDEDNISDRYLSMSNVKSGSYTAYDITNGYKYRITEVGGNLQMVVPKSTFQHEMVVAEESNIQSLSPEPYTFRPIDIDPALNYVIISSRKLEKSAVDYKKYRESDAGGGYTPILAYAEDLYDQYYYGLHHPMAVKNFLAEIVDKYETPDNVFIIGKGISVFYLRSGGTGTSLSHDLVPTIGFPPSDSYYGVNLIKGRYLPPFGVGRLAATNDEEVEVYLEKVKFYEKLGPALWRKNFLHVSGGVDEAEITRFASYLENMADVAEGPKIGARVHALGKSTKSVIEDIDQSIIDRIDNGVSFFSYFGHASANNLEINIGDPTVYNNAQKPMVMYFSGCVIGNCFDPTVFLGESYLSAKTGAVNWIAPSYLSLENEVNTFSVDFYKELSLNSYGHSVGEIMRATMEEFTQIGLTQSETQSLLYIIQGDPANRVYSPEKPDYLIQSDDIYITPDGVTAQDDEFIINVIARNQGLVTEDSVNCKISITFPNNSAPFDTVVRIPPITHSHTFSVTIDNSQRKQFGIFKITAQLDPENVVAELMENNNTMTYEFNLISNGAALVYPTQYGIVSEKIAELTAQGLDPSRTNSTYYFEIDTVETFKSPWKKRSGALKKGQLAKWKIDLLEKDTQAYYWRVRVQLQEGGLSPWRSSSFSHINNSPSGWAQVEFHQQKTGQIESMLFDTTKRGTEFATTFPKSYYIWQHGRAYGAWSVQPYTYGNFPPGNDEKAIREPVSGGAFAEPVANGLTENGMVVYALDPYKLKAFQPGIGLSHPAITQEQGEYRFNWMTSESTFDPNVVDSFIKFMEAIPRGYHVFLYTGYYHHLAGMNDERIYQLIEGCGSKDIKGVQNDGIWCMIGQKGLGKGRGEEDYTTDQGILLLISKSIGESRSSGKQQSTLIGPAKKWRLLQNTVANYDLDKTHDEYDFNVYGYTKSGQKQILAGGLTSLETDISFIDAKTYPYLQLELEVKDDVEFTPIQLKTWTVIYDDLPDGMINSEIAYDFDADTISRGQDLKFSIGYLNISNLPLPEHKVSYSIIDSDRQVKAQMDETIPALQPGEQYILKKSFGSADLAGSNRFVLKTNSDNAVLELYNFNNGFERVFYVSSDNQQPLLDVTFDGYRILNGDIISPTPSIKISGKDNDQYFLLNDPDYFDITLQKEGDLLPTQIDVTNPAVTFSPANDGNNQALFEYSPERLEDGMYTLSVQLRDGSGNKAGKIAYEVNFEVVGASTVTHFYPYPNPFSTEMKFVYTLTGENLPDEMLIQIMTVSGKVVKEIDLAQFGDIKIGHNISEYSWDGTDDFGNYLANGVYLYRVKTGINNKQIEHRSLANIAGETDLEGQFTEGFGKIYILR